MKKGYIMAVLGTGLALTLLLLLAWGSTASGETSHLHMNMKAGDELHPETKGDPNASAEQLTVHAEYEQIGTVKTNSQWVFVGEWTTDEIQAPMNVSGTEVHFNLWVKQVDSGDNSADFRFNLEHNGDNIAHDEVYDLETSEEEVLELRMETAVNVWINATTGDTFTISFYYRGWNDIDLYYDNASYDSGALIESDFLHVFEAGAKKDSFSLEVYDVFGSDWGEVASFMDLKVNGESWSLEDFEVNEGKTHDINGTDVEGILLSFTLDTRLSKDDELEVWVKYTQVESSEDRGIKLEFTAGGSAGEDPGSGGNTEPEDADNGGLPGFGLFSLGVASLAVFLALRRKRSGL